MYRQILWYDRERNYSRHAKLGTVFYLGSFASSECSLAKKSSPEPARQLPPSTDSVPKHGAFHTLHCVQKASPTRLACQVQNVLCSSERWLNIRIQRYSNRKKLNSVHIRCRLSVFEIMQRAKVKNGVILQSAGRTSLLEI